jgi:Integrase core domain
MTTGCDCSSSNQASRIQNAFIESFNSRLREQCLNEHVFVSLDDAGRKSNGGASHTTAGDRTPAWAI